MVDTPPFEHPSNGAKVNRTLKLEAPNHTKTYKLVTLSQKNKQKTDNVLPAFLPHGYAPIFINRNLIWG